MSVRTLVVTILAAGLWTVSAAADSGLVSKKSDYSAAETVERLVRAVGEANLVVLARIDHAAAATRAGLELRFTELVIFGNPRAGTGLMQSRPTIGIDLPLKALVWQDEAGEVWLTYNAPAYLAERHRVGDRAAIIQSMTGALERLSDAATRR